MGQLGLITAYGTAQAIRYLARPGFTVGLYGLQVEEDPTGGKYAGAASALNGAPHKLESVIQFHVGDVVTSLQRAVMQPGGQECIMYGTVMGAVGQCQLADVPITAPLAA